MADPPRVEGYGSFERPGLPPGPNNRTRTWLTIRHTGLPWNPMANPLIFRAGCP